MNNSTDSERHSSANHDVDTSVEAIDRCLLFLWELGSVFVNMTAQKKTVNHETTKEYACEDAVENNPHLLIENANHRQGCHGSDSEIEHCVVAAV